MTNITLPKKVVEQALDALCDTETPAYRPQYGVESLAIYDLRCALDQCEAEDPAQHAWAKTVRLAKVALHETPRPHTDWMEAARAVCESVVKVGNSQEEKQPVEQQDESAYQRGYRDGVVKGRKELIAEYPLERDLYDSKDWRCGSYAERVEWLHTMYESAREQVAELEKPQVAPGAGSLQTQVLYPVSMGVCVVRCQAEVSGRHGPTPLHQPTAQTSSTDRGSYSKAGRYR